MPDEIRLPAILKLSRELGTQQLTRLVAYSLWEMRGGPQDNWSDWFDAEKIFPPAFWADLENVVRNRDAALASSVVSHMLFHAEEIGRVIHFPWPPRGLFTIEGDQALPAPAGASPRLRLRARLGIPHLELGLDQALSIPYPARLSVSDVSVKIDGIVDAENKVVPPERVALSLDGIFEFRPLDLVPEQATAVYSGDTTLSLERHACPAGVYRLLFDIQYRLRCRRQAVGRYPETEVRKPDDELFLRERPHLDVILP